jgi:hypothetical protein
MIYSAGDLGVQIDLGPDKPGMIIQRREPDGWRLFHSALCRVSRSSGNFAGMSYS